MENEKKEQLNAVVKSGKTTSEYKLTFWFSVISTVTGLGVALAAILIEGEINMESVLAIGVSAIAVSNKIKGYSDSRAKVKVAAGD